MRAASALLLLIACASSANGSFECLPGPEIGSPAGAASWMAAADPGRAEAWRCIAASGRPAAVAGLGWTYLSFSILGHSVRGSIEAYQLNLEEAYREQLAGLRVGRGPLDLGLRAWRTGWEGARSEAGWSAGARVSGRRGRWSARLAIEDLLVGRSRSSRPMQRTEAGVSLDLGGGLDARGTVSRGAEGWEVGFAARWAVHPALTIRQDYAGPRGALVTGMEARRGRLTVALSLEPAGILGYRISTAVVARSGGGG